MRLSTIAPTTWLFKRQPGNRTVSRDADDLMLCCGDRAYDAAELNSYHEDLGLIATERPGHWDRVAREIARRSGHKRHEPRADFAA